MAAQHGRTFAGNALSNDYQRMLGELYDEITKPVLAAVAVSALTTGGEDLAKACQRLAQEWDTLYAAGIVPQRPGKIAKRYLTENASKQH